MSEKDDIINQLTKIRDEFSIDKKNKNKIYVLLIKLYNIYKKENPLRTKKSIIDEIIQFGIKNSNISESLCQNLYTLSNLYNKITDINIKNKIDSYELGLWTYYGNCRNNRNILLDKMDVELPDNDGDVCIHSYIPFEDTIRRRINKMKKELNLEKIYFTAIQNDNKSFTIEI